MQNVDACKNVFRNVSTDIHIYDNRKCEENVKI